LSNIYQLVTTSYSPSSCRKISSQEQSQNIPFFTSGKVKFVKRQGATVIHLFSVNGHMINFIQKNFNDFFLTEKR
jgi:hypothetical protein